LSDIFGKLKTGAGKVAHEADKTAHIKRIEMQIGSINKQIENHYTKLGEMIYDSKVKGEPDNPEAADIQTKITDLKQQIASKERRSKISKKTRS
jgi:hypothetical protein